MYLGKEKEMLQHTLTRPKYSSFMEPTIDDQIFPTIINKWNDNTYIHTVCNIRVVVVFYSII